MVLLFGDEYKTGHVRKNQYLQPFKTQHPLQQRHEAICLFDEQI